MKFQSKQFNEIWAVDFEYFGADGDIPNPVCLVGRELLSNRIIQVWRDDLLQLENPPYDISKDSLFISYYAPAEIGCHLALNWNIPVNILDLYAEFRNLTNGRPLPCGRGLVGALTYFGFNSISALKKDIMRELILTGGPWSAEEKASILKYCQEDVEVLALLLEEMIPDIDLNHALLRGQYMASVAKMENAGVPIDASQLNLFLENWDTIKRALIDKFNADYQIYDGLSFRSENFAKWLFKNGIPWPQLDSGALDLKDDTFKEMAQAYPAITPLRELRVTLSQMRLSALAIGSDGRNRTMLSPFGAKTSRNTPSNSKSIFGPSTWLRSLIKPEPETGLAYIDWRSQEHGIAAKLSGDLLMLDAHLSGDPYLGFAKQVGAVPMDATKQSHSQERENFKACVLGVNYGMGENALAGRIHRPVYVARDLLKRHRETYKQFWKWSDGALDFAMFYGYLKTVFGWIVYLPSENLNPRMLRNFLIQANAAEMLRLAILLIHRQGIKICVPIHDAVLVEAPLSELSEVVKSARECMAEASRTILSGFELGTDVKLIKYPNRYFDKRGKAMWNMIDGILKSVPCKEQFRKQSVPCREQKCSL